MRTYRAATHEMKFLLEDNAAREMEAQLRLRLSLDPHANRLAGNSYRITTLYGDTPELDVMHRRGRHRFLKLRIRRYDNREQIYLERKSKHGLEVRKRRTMVDINELGRFAEQPQNTQWAGARYHAELIRNRYQPVCLLHYSRIAYFGPGELGPVRVTFDRAITGGLLRSWSFTDFHAAIPLAANLVVCELKYQGFLPHLFKSVIETLRLTPVGFSKYRQCIQTTGLLTRGAPANA